MYVYINVWALNSMTDFLEELAKDPEKLHGQPFIASREGDEERTCYTCKHRELHRDCKLERPHILFHGAFVPTELYTFQVGNYCPLWKTQNMEENSGGSMAAYSSGE